MSIRYDWTGDGLLLVAMFNRIMRWVLPCIAAVLWVLCIRLAVHDWTVLLAPPLPTAGAVVYWYALRKVYQAAPPAAAAPCPHPSPVPVEALLGEVVAKLCTDCGEQLAADFEPGENFRRTLREVAATLPAGGYGVTMTEAGENLTRVMREMTPPPGAFGTLATLRRERHETEKATTAASSGCCSRGRGTMPP